MNNMFGNESPQPRSSKVDNHKKRLLNLRIHCKANQLKSAVHSSSIEINLRQELHVNKPKSKQNEDDRN